MTPEPEDLPARLPRHEAERALPTVYRKVREGTCHEQGDKLFCRCKTAFFVPEFKPKGVF